MKVVLFSDSFVDLRVMIDHAELSIRVTAATNLDWYCQNQKSKFTTTPQPVIDQM
jgi:hypothetical protein